MPVAPSIWSFWKTRLTLPVMDDRAHKAHRPAQSGAKAEKKSKGKEKQKGFNEKVRILYTPVCKLAHV